MSTGDPQAPGGGPSEEELRAAYEAEIKKVRVEQILLEQVVSLVNMGMRRTALSPGTEDERDLGQVGLSIDAVRALLPLIERVAPPQVGPIRDALSQLQMAFVRLGGVPGGETAPGSGPAGEPPAPESPASAPSGGAGETPGDPSQAPGSPAAGPGGGPPPPPSPAPEPGQGGEPGPAQRSGRLWVPGQ